VRVITRDSLSVCAGEGGVPLARRFMGPADAAHNDNGNFWCVWLCGDVSVDATNRYGMELPFATILVLSFEHNVTAGSRQVSVV
jgi:hypothetical protein